MLFDHVAFAQQDEAASDSLEWHPYQVGFAASSILKVLEEGNASNQYQLYGRYRINRRWSLRTALRYRQVVSEEKEVRLGLRVGTDYVFRKEGRLELYGGADLITGYNRFLNKNRAYRVGVAPLFGVLFHISPHVSLSTEPSLVATYVYSENRSSAEPDAQSVSIALRGIGVLVLSVHF